MTQHRLGETLRLGDEGGECVGRTFGDGPLERIELDFSNQVHAAGHRPQSIGQALFLPSIGLALLGIEKVQGADEIAMKPVFPFDGARLHMSPPRRSWRSAYGIRIVTAP